jgi:hypothetical protein
MNVNLSSVVRPMRAFWDELVDRRLWPVAIALLVGIFAVPFLLSKPAKQAPAPPIPVATGASPTGVAFTPAVSTEGRKSSEIRKRLKGFTRKDPFTPQGVKLGSSGAAGTAAPIAGSATAGSATPSLASGAGSGSATSPSSTGSGTSGSGTGTGTAGTSPGSSTKTFYYHYTVDVRFGKTGQEDAKTLTDFRALPGTDNPVVIFMGVRADGVTAVFLVSANATTNGDGTCQPSDTECTFLYMKKRDSQLIEAVGSDGAVTDYTLELRDINVEKTSGPKKATSSKSAHAKLRRKAKSAHAKHRRKAKSAHAKHRRKAQRRFRHVVVRGVKNIGF